MEPSIHLTLRNVTLESVHQILSESRLPFAENDNYSTAEIPSSLSNVCKRFRFGHVDYCGINIRTQICELAENLVITFSIAEMKKEKILEFLDYVEMIFVPWRVEE